MQKKKSLNFEIEDIIGEQGNRRIKEVIIEPATKWGLPLNSLQLHLVIEGNINKNKVISIKVSIGLLAIEVWMLIQGYLLEWL